MESRILSALQEKIPIHLDAMMGNDEMCNGDTIWDKRRRKNYAYNRSCSFHENLYKENMANCKRSVTTYECGSADTDFGDFDVAPLNLEGALRVIDTLCAWDIQMGENVCKNENKSGDKNEVGDKLTYDSDTTVTCTPKVQSDNITSPVSKWGVPHAKATASLVEYMKNALSGVGVYNNQTGVRFNSMPDINSTSGVQLGENAAVEMPKVNSTKEILIEDQCTKSSDVGGDEFCSIYEHPRLNSLGADNLSWASPLLNILQGYHKKIRQDKSNYALVNLCFESLTNLCTSTCHKKLVSKVKQRHDPRQHQLTLLENWEMMSEILKNLLIERLEYITSLDCSEKEREWVLSALLPLMLPANKMLCDMFEMIVTMCTMDKDIARYEATIVKAAYHVRHISNKNVTLENRINLLTRQFNVNVGSTSIVKGSAHDISNDNSDSSKKGGVVCNIGQSSQSCSTGENPMDPNFPSGEYSLSHSVKNRASAKIASQSQTLGDLVCKKCSDKSHTSSEKCDGGENKFAPKFLSEFSGDSTLCRNLKRQNLNKIGAYGDAPSIWNQSTTFQIGVDDGPIGSLFHNGGSYATCTSIHSKKNSHGFRTSEDSQDNDGANFHINSNSQESGHNIHVHSSCNPRESNYDGIKKYKGKKYLTNKDDAPMPGVRYARDRNSWVAFWNESGRQSYKSFSWKKFGYEKARELAIEARSRFNALQAKHQSHKKNDHDHRYRNIQQVSVASQNTGHDQGLT